MNFVGTDLLGRDIVCLGTQEWDAHWTPAQQVASRLAPGNRVIYVEPFHPVFSRFRRGNHVYRRQIREGVPQLREVTPNLWVYRPGYSYLPLNMKSRLAHALNTPLYLAELRALWQRMGLSRPWLWAFIAQSTAVLDLPFERVIYDCVDDWPSFFPDPAEKAFITGVDRALTARADLVFVGSDPLLAKKRHENARMFVVNHAADIPHFSKAADPTGPLPEDLAAIPRPRLGFVGMVDALRFDPALIAALAANSNWHVVIVGGFLGDAAAAMPVAPNIHVLGMKPVAELPSYLRGIDVCLMPYRTNEATKYIFPLKLFEYLATGKPVVSTPIPAALQVSDYLRIADTPAAFVSAAAEAIQFGASGGAERMVFAAGHSWEAHTAAKVGHLRRFIS